jgi:protein transport protein SEC24
MADHKKKRAYAAQAYEFGANAAPAAGAAPPLVPAPGQADNLAGQFGQMNLGAQQPGYPQQPAYQQPGYQQPGVQQVQPQAPAAATQLNQLFPSDLIQQVCLLKLQSGAQGPANMRISLSMF